MRTKIYVYKRKLDDLLVRGSLTIKLLTYYIHFIKISLNEYIN